jgi:signal transduction histidine kinase
VHSVAVVREAVINVVRHAAAAAAVTVPIEVGYELVIEVVDDGVGIGCGPQRAPQHGGAGARVRGELTVRPGAPAGSRLSWRVPLR